VHSDVPTVVARIVSLPRVGRTEPQLTCKSDCNENPPPRSFPQSWLFRTGTVAYPARLS